MKIDKKLIKELVDNLNNLLVKDNNINKIALINLLKTLRNE